MQRQRIAQERLPSPRPPSGDDATVLVVDDESALRDALSEVFGSRFDVRTAEHGAHALRLIDSEPGIAAVVCDVRMPWMNGVELHRTLVAKSHPLARRFVWMTDEGLSAAHERYVSTTELPRLTKPFRLDALEALLEATVGASPRAR